MKTLPVNIPTLKAIYLAASHDFLRYYLSGVYLEATAEHVTYVATNGHILAARRLARSPQEAEADPFIGNIIVPSLFIGRVRRSALSVMETEDGKIFALGEELFNPIDATYPDWRKVTKIPKEEPLTTLGRINPALLVTLDKIGESLGLGIAKCSPSGDGNPALVRFQNEREARTASAFGVVMPMRVSTIDRALPGWMTEEEK